MSKRSLYVDIRGYHKGVTGSSIRNTVHFVNGNKFRYLVDYGVYQGEGHKGIEYNDSVNPEKIDTILLTHTHLDHDGALPIIVKKGYRNKKIHMSDASACVLDIGLNDSYNIMKKEAKLKKQPLLFSTTDIEMTLKQVEPAKYGQTIKIHDNITVIFFNNGHLIGSSIILVQIYDPDSSEMINLLYTGDYKPDNVFLDLQPIPSWVYSLPHLTIITESTYGTTNSWDIEKVWENDMINLCSNNKIIINTAFAQGRFQELMYRVKKLQDERLIPEDYPVRVDGKTGFEYTFRYISHSNIIRIKEEMKTFFPKNIQFVTDKSRPSIMSYKGGQIIITTSGMGNHGPAATYIPNYLSNPNAAIYFPGYTSEGTIGRKVLEAENNEEILFKNSKSIIKRASVYQTLEFSSHAPADILIAFLNQFYPVSILINHGEHDTKIGFEKRVQQETHVKKTGILGEGLVYRIDSFGISKAVQK